VSLRLLLFIAVFVAGVGLVVLLIMLGNAFFL
jgi:hypothetical protein